MKNIKFTGNEPISQIIHKLPMASQIFTAHGLGCAACPNAQFETLKAGLIVHGFDENEINRVIEDLNLAAEELDIAEKKELLPKGIKKS